jgi:hypothetical protein
MKNLLWLILLSLPLAMKAQFKIVNSATINIVDVRQGTWPISLQRITKPSDTCYVLQFRTQEFNNSVIIKTLKFRDLGQLKYFQQGLTALKTGNKGDVDEFKD